MNFRTKSKKIQKAQGGYTKVAQTRAELSEKYLKEIGCARSTVSYHCGKAVGKEKELGLGSQLEKLLYVER